MSVYVVTCSYWLFHWRKKIEYTAKTFASYFLSCFSFFSKIKEFPRHDYVPNASEIKVKSDFLQ
jgi:hypothetical protein